MLLHPSHCQRTGLRSHSYGSPLRFPQSHGPFVRREAIHLFRERERRHSLSLPVFTWHTFQKITNEVEVHVHVVSRRGGVDSLDVGDSREKGLKGVQKSWLEFGPVDVFV